MIPPPRLIPPLRRATADDLPAIGAAQGRAFGFHMSPADIEDFRPLFEPDRWLLAHDPADPDPVVAVAASYPFDVTLPGGSVLPAPGVTWVSVAATHRRRGVLRALMTEQLRGFVADGVAVALLTASEGGIYGRFGYGAATTDRRVEIDRRFVMFRPGAPDPGGARFADAAQARAHAPDVHRRWCVRNPGAVSRSERWWENVFLDREHHRGGGTALFHLLHDDGYASFRRGPNDTCRVADLFAVTEDAHAALWRVVLGLDLVQSVSTTAVPADDPLPFLLADGRRVRTTGLADGLWARILDVPVALAARTYATELDVVVEVGDPFLDRGGRFRLRGDLDGAVCEPTTGPPDVHLDVAALGSLLFGGHRAQTLARARLIDAPDPAVLRRVDAAFTAEREPQYGTSF